MALKVNRRISEVIGSSTLAITAIEEGFTKYTPSTGILQLKVAIAPKFQNDNQLEYQPFQVAVSCDTKDSIQKKVVIFNSSSNSTGMLYSKEELENIAECCYIN